MYMPQKVEPRVHMVIRAIKETHPALTYTSIQLNIGMASGLHSGGANGGPSLVVALGPHTGGQLWVHHATEGHVIDVERWQPTNGRIPHCSLPFAGQHASIVLFTYAAACSRQSSEAVQAVAMAGFPVPTTHCLQSVQ